MTKFVNHTPIDEVQLFVRKVSKDSITYWAVPYAPGNLKYPTLIRTLEQEDGNCRYYPVQLLLEQDKVPYYAVEALKRLKVRQSLAFKVKRLLRLC